MTQTAFKSMQTLMTIDDLTDYLKVSRRTIYEWLKHNKIPAIKLVGQWRFQKDKIDYWMEHQSVS
jgi:PTS system nitrogen regulatory IIA component